MANIGGLTKVIVSQFIEALIDSGLMTADDVDDFLDALPPEKKPNDGETLARELVRKGKLTKFQAQAVYQGKAKGLILGDYVVLDRIGQGGMGHVYKAKHKTMDRVVALKTLPSAATKSERAVQRFHREVKIAARLSHPNIVTAHDAGESQGVHYLVMEHVEGSDLSVLVRTKGTLTVRTAINYILQAARGLEYAHNKNVIHRDIKPSNLVLDREGTVKVLDMGLARLDEIVGPYDSTAEKTLTGTGQAMGTIDFMPPEQAENTKTVDERADIYSLGCSLYYLLMGRAVYAGDTTVVKLLAHREAAIPSLRAERPDTPEKLDLIFQKMVAKRPQDRHGSMTEVIAELEECAAPRPEQFEETTDLGSVPLSPSHVGTSPAVKTGETPADESLPLDYPVVSPVDSILRKHPKKDKRQLIIIGSVAAGLAAIALLLSVVFMLMTPKSTVVVTVNQPDAEISVNYTEVTLAPPHAVAPFTPTEAKQHQRAWAEHLGVPVESENSIGMKMVLIPPGEFMMGSSEEEIEAWLKEAGEAGEVKYLPALQSEGPGHKVRITEPFRLAAHEVTLGQFKAFEEATAYKTEAETAGDQWTWPNVWYKTTDDHPVVCVSWNDAVAFCEWLSEKDGKTYRLPTEAEWEYACRAGSTTRWFFGDDDKELAQYCWIDQEQHAVGLKLPNALGLFDVYGNVRDWCSDRHWPDYYSSSPVNDPKGSSSGANRVFRSLESGSAARNWGLPAVRATYVGFRPARTYP